MNFSAHGNNILAFSNNSGRPAQVAVSAATKVSVTFADGSHGPIPTLEPWTVYLLCVPNNSSIALSSLNSQSFDYQVEVADTLY